RGIKSRKEKDFTYFYFAKAEVVGDYQVIRNFHCSVSYRHGRGCLVNEYEVLQHWILPSKVGLYDDRKRLIVARVYSNYQGFWSGDLQIRNNYSTGYNYHRYDVSPDLFTNDSVFKPEFVKRGIDKKI